MSDPRVTFNDGNTMPQIGFGLWEVPKNETARVVADGLAAGYRLIDGAAIYGNEEGLGEGLKATAVPRGDIFVTSKIWNSEHGFDTTLAALDGSLARIGTDYLDLCLIHWPVPDANRYVDTWKALIRAKEDGKVRSIGVSNFLTEHLDRIIGETGVTPVLNQIELHPTMAQGDARAVHETRGVITQSWTPLGKGTAFDAAPVLAAASRTGKSPAQIIIRWHVQLGCSVIPRSTKAHRLAENRDVFDFELTPDEMEAITALDRDNRLGPHPLTFG